MQFNTGVLKMYRIETIDPITGKSLTQLVDMPYVSAIAIFTCRTRPDTDSSTMGICPKTNRSEIFRPPARGIMF
jgi:hypothetical protein